MSLWKILKIQKTFKVTYGFHIRSQVKIDV